MKQPDWKDELKEYWVGLDVSKRTLDAALAERTSDFRVRHYGRCRGNPSRGPDPVSSLFWSGWMNTSPGEWRVLSWKQRDSIRLN